MHWSLSAAAVAARAAKNAIDDKMLHA